MTKQIEEIVIQKYIEGNSAPSIAKELSLGATTIYSILKRNNIKTRTTGESRIKYKKSFREEIAKLYRDGMDGTQIAEKFNMSFGVVYSLLKKENCIIRDPTEYHRQFKYNEHFFDKINTEERAYILGFIYADGTVSKNTFSLRLQEQDKEILDKIHDCLEMEQELKFISYPSNIRKNQYCLSITNEHFIQELKNKGVVPNKTFKIEFPKWLDKKLYPHFIRGYFDGDGCVWFNHHKGEKKVQSMFGIVATEDFCLEIQKILLENCQANLHIRKRFKDKPESYVIRQAECGGNKQVKRILDYLYKDSHIYLKRKYEKYLEVLELNN